MIRIVFVLVITIVIATMMMGKYRKKRAKQDWLEEPGRSPDAPIMVQRFDEMDRFVRDARCHCGGRPEIVSEGSKTIEGQQVRVIRADCDECGAELYFFFAIDKVLH